MLVITRKVGDSILIGDNIEVTITAIDGSSVKVAVNAPRDITILRKELYKEVQEENKEALKGNLDLLKGLKK